MIPSGIHPQSTAELEIKKVRPGLYSVKDAYAGEYRFFPSHSEQSAQFDREKNSGSTPRPLPVQEVCTE